jgi:PIN domain nuclease of toxin-antitoxin system
MQLLIDTQAILWFQASDSKLTIKATNLIADQQNKCFVSMASLWEMAIKVASNKLSVGMPFENFQSYLIDNDFQILNYECSKD